MKIQIPVEFVASVFEEEKVQEALAKLSGAVAVIGDGTDVEIVVSDGLARAALEDGVAEAGQIV